MNNLVYKVAYGAEQVSINADTLLRNIADKILNPIIGLMISIALLLFIYGVIEFIYGADNEDKRKQGKQHIIWGIIGLFIMVSVLGIMKIIINFWEGI
ncbi:MAG: hypothetical protein COU71_00895 [Parcubacteria group bacterium CG10_big_fil_rev_8_21_14_0_10_38_31]|nr:MAG: hypothetical protein COU71_00895 [Parcubacteria group bacterium CG10_big_fil_rev_8_21_14_0_10_38_31]